MNKYFFSLFIYSPYLQRRSLNKNFIFQKIYFKQKFIIKVLSNNKSFVNKSQYFFILSIICLTIYIVQIQKPYIIKFSNNKMNIQNPHNSYHPFLAQNIIGTTKMVGACLLIIIALAYLWRPKNKNNQSTNKWSRNKIPTKPTKKKFHFNPEEFQSQEEQLIDFINGQSTETFQKLYSLKQDQQNFIQNLQSLQSKSCIYYDKQDIKQRQLRSQEMQKRQKQENQIVLKQPIQVKKDVQKNKQVNQQNKGNKISKKEIGEKNIFANKEVDFIEVPVTPLPGNVKPVGQKNAQVNVNQAPMFPKVQIKKDQQIQPTIPAPSLFSQTPSLFSQTPFSSNTLPKAQNGSLFGPTSTLPASQKQATNLSPLNIPNNQKAVISIQNVIPPPNIISQPSVSINLPPIQPVQSNVSQNQDNIQIKKNRKVFLQKFIQYGLLTKQTCQLAKAKTNNFGRSISNLKQLYQTAVDFINSINVSDSKEVQTLACKIFDFLFYTTIPGWPKQQGWQKFPPRGKNSTTWKISINTYVIKLNIYRAMGHQKLWLIIFGKLLNLLQFMWKRQTQITKYQDLELVKNKYFNLDRQDDMAPKYFTRLDLVTYFLFCMTTFDPELLAQYLCQTAKQDQAVYESIKKLKYKWSYQAFWILVETILENKTPTYFRPIVYMNILSSMYLQIRKNKINSTEFAEFDHLKKHLLKQAIQYTDKTTLAKNKQIQALGDIYEQKQREKFKFDGQDFLGQVQTLNFYFKEKQAEYRKGIQEFEKRCSVFDYFKSQSGGPN